MLSRSVADPVNTFPSRSVKRTTSDGQKNPSAFTRITPIRPATMIRARARAPPVSQMNGSPLRQSLRTPARFTGLPRLPLRLARPRSQVAILAPQAQTHELGHGVHGQRQAEEKEGGQKEEPEQRAALRRLRQL